MLSFNQTEPEIQFFHQTCVHQAELGEMDTWQGDANAWEDESEAAWEAEEVLR